MASALAGNADHATFTRSHDTEQIGGQFFNQVGIGRWRIQQSNVDGEARAHVRQTLDFGLKQACPLHQTLAGMKAVPALGCMSGEIPDGACADKRNHDLQPSIIPSLVHEGVRLDAELRQNSGRKTIAPGAFVLGTRWHVYRSALKAG